MGFGVVKQDVFPSNTADFMSYCSPEWISPYHWKKLFDALAPVGAGSGAGISAPQAYALVSGLVSESGGELDPLLVVESDAAAPEPPAGGDYCIEFEDDLGEPLSTDCFDLSFLDPESGDPAGVAPFSYVLPYPDEAAGVVLLRNDEILDERLSSASTPELSLIAPSGGETWDGIETVVWEAADADKDELTFAVFYSNDDGASWIPVAMDLAETSYELDTTLLPGSNTARVRVSASDGFLNTEVDSPPLTVARKAPEATVRSPSSGASRLAHESLALSGSAYDREDGTLTGEALSWWSDRDGLLGRGATVLVAGGTLSSGWHTITLVATDSDGLAGESRVEIFVGETDPVPCAGDCGADGPVTLDELVRAVNVALGNDFLATCFAIDRNADGQATVDELVAAVRDALSGCGRSDLF